MEPRPSMPARLGSASRGETDKKTSMTLGRHPKEGAAGKHDTEPGWPFLAIVTDMERYLNGILRC